MYCALYCTGAMYFSIAVILIYGISIAMLVAASTLRRSHSDYELKSFMRSYARLDVERRSREKQRTRAVLQRLDRLSSAQQPPQPSSLLAAAVSVPHAAVTIGFRPAAPNVLRPVTLLGPGLSVAAGSARQPSRPDRSPPTVNVVDVDVSTGDCSYHGDDGDGVLRGAAMFGTDVLRRHHHHHHHQHQQQQQERPVAASTAAHDVSCLPRHLSERSLLVPKCNGEFNVPQPSSRRNTAL